MKVVFGAVVYEAAYYFYRDFVTSINYQNYSEFDVLILNDDLSEKKIQRLILEINRSVTLIETDSNLTPQELRIELIKRAKEKEYDLLIIGDFDDTMSKNRISEIVLNYDDNYCFFYNDLFYLNTEKKFFHSLPSVIEDINPILECNFLGLSNTALNLNKIHINTLEILDNKPTVAFDWIIFSLLLLQGHKGKKIGKCKTFYRIYDQNTAGETDISIKGLKKEIEIKIDHYSKLIDIDPTYIVLHELYGSLNDSFEEYSKLLLRKSTINNRYWWGRLNKNIILKEREIYENQK